MAPGSRAPIGRMPERGDVAITGSATDFWHRYEEDFARCRELGLKAFRLGLEWSRIQPALAPGESNPPRSTPPRLTITRIVAPAGDGAGAGRDLHHFVHPAWLGSDPWLEGHARALCGVCPLRRGLCE